MSGYLGSWKVDDLLTFVVNTQVFATGVATDADGVPTYRVYEDETTTPILTGSMALLDAANTAGLYSEQITLSAANGFEKGKAYSIYIAATVSSVAGTTNRNFQIEAEVDSNSVSNIGAGVITAAAVATDAIDADAIAANAIDAGAIATGAITAAKFAAGAIDAAALAADAGTEIASAVWDMDATAHQTQGTFGQAIGDPAADTNTIYKAVVTDATGSTVGVDVVAVQADTDDIQTRLPAALSSGNMKCDVLAISGDTTAADNEEAFFDGTGYAGTNNVIPNVTTVNGLASGVITAASIAANAITAAKVASGAITSATFAAGAIDATAIAADAIGSSELAASAVTEIQTGLSTLTAAEVNAEIVDALNVDTYTEPAQGTPSATPTIRTMLHFLYKAFRNKVTQTSTTYSLFADDTTTVDQKATVSDDGSTLTRGEIASGP